ncbi:MAG: zinc ribbon domain-containing protein [Candidatus Riflebacteria bacterium]|nr:zinc ribbon domain-containing protein [Candidatus Riflebacteria bacterium]
MPIYEFNCTSCKKDFDLLLSLKADHSQVTCPDCSSGNVRKKVSSFARGSSSSDSSPDYSSSHGSSSGCGSCSTHSCGSCGHH